MGILTNLKRMISGDTNETSSNNESKCLIYIDLTKAEYNMFSVLYYKGYTSYKTFYKLVFFNNISKLEKLFSDAMDKANIGCIITETIVRFIYKDNMFIDIPFDVFSDKRSMRKNIIEHKNWHKANIKRLISNNPDFINLDKTLIGEAFIAIIKETLEE